MLGRKACTHKRGVGRADALGADPAGMTGKPELTLTSRQRSSPRVALTTGPRVHLVFEEAPRAPLASASNSRSLATSRRYGLILSLRALLLESNADQRRAGAGSTIVFEDPSGAACMPGGDCPCGLSAGVPRRRGIKRAGVALRLVLALRRLVGAPRAVRRIAGHAIAGLT